jgi:hypothetical protein
MDDKKLPDTETNTFCNEPIHFWVIADNNIKGELDRFDIIISDPVINKKVKMDYEQFKAYPHDDPVYLNYDWRGLTFEIEKIRNLAIENGKQRKANWDKKTSGAVIYKKIHYYNSHKEGKEEVQDEDRGVIIEKVTANINKELRKTIKSSEKTIETFYAIEYITGSESPHKLWVEDKIIDDLLDREVKDIRIMTDEGTFYIETNAFLTHGSIKDEKVYIDLDTYPFTVHEMRGGQFDVSDKVK